MFSNRRATPLYKASPIDVTIPSGPYAGSYPYSYSASTLAQIYKCPPPPPDKKAAIAVVSLGGGLYGNVDANGILTNGDCQAYWAWQGVAASNYPTVKLVFLQGTTNNYTDSGPTGENTLDIEMIGSWYPSSNLTIVMYFASNVNTFPEFYDNYYNVMIHATTTQINVNGTYMLPSAVSVSWQFQEFYAYDDYNYFNLPPLTFFNTINTIYSNAAANGINICIAAGDLAGTDGTTSRMISGYTSSPWCIACGGTSLLCANNIYDVNTVETVWNNSNQATAPYNEYGTGGGISLYVSQGQYQSTVTSFANTQYRCVPDISLNADAYTPIVYIVNGVYTPIGGTSAVAPMIAAFLTLSGIKYFWNTKLYKLHSNCFHDITVGNNRPLVDSTLGYDARVGYDLCTGFGSIIGNTMSTAMNTYVPTSNIQFTHILSNFGYFSTVKVPFYSTLSNTKWYDSSGNLTIPPTTNIPFSFFQNKMCRF